MLASRHPGLEIKTLYYYTLYSAVKYIHIQPLVEDAARDDVYQTRELTWLDILTRVSIFESSQSEGSYIGNLLYLTCFSNIKFHSFPTKLVWTSEDRQGKCVTWLHLLEWVNPLYTSRLWLRHRVEGSRVCPAERQLLDSRTSSQTHHCKTRIS